MIINPIFIASMVVLSDKLIRSFPPFVRFAYIQDISDLSERQTGVILDDGAHAINLASFIPYIHVSQLEFSVNRHHFLLSSIVLATVNDILCNNVKKRAIIDFHSRYKLLLLAHSQPHYRKLGPLVATTKKQTINQFIQDYRHCFMQGLSIISTKKNHANVLFHLQGYFRAELEADKRQKLAQLIQDYLTGKVSLDEPIRQLKTYLVRYPKPYLEGQAYFNFYPTIMDSRNVDSSKILS